VNWKNDGIWLAGAVPVGAIAFGLGMEIASDWRVGLLFAIVAAWLILVFRRKGKAKKLEDDGYREPHK